MANGSPSGNISWAEVKDALIGAAEWGVSTFATVFGMGMVSQPKPDLKTLAITTGVVAASGFLIRVGRIFGTNTLNGNGGGK